MLNCKLDFGNVENTDPDENTRGLKLLLSSHVPVCLQVVVAGAVRGPAAELGADGADLARAEHGLLLPQRLQPEGVGPDQSLGQ